MSAARRAIGAALLSLTALACASRPVAEIRNAGVTGTASYRERISLPPQAVLDVTLEDVSRAGAAALVLGSARMRPAGSAPIPFEITYDPALIDSTRRYAVRARVTVDGELWFSTDRSYPVITGGNGNEVTLMMVSTRGASPGATSPAELRNTYWKLVSLGDKPVTVADGQREAHFVLRADTNQMHGSGGCNRMFGTYEVGGETLRFSGVGSTKMACAAGMDTEAEFLPALARVARWRIGGQQLELMDAAGALVARFEARVMK